MRPSHVNSEVELEVEDEVIPAEGKGREVEAVTRAKRAERKCRGGVSDICQTPETRKNG